MRSSTPPDEPDAARLWDMLRAAHEVRQFISGKAYEAYERDRMLRRAVERSIEIIGEAARHVSREFQSSHPQVAWRLIVAQRHVLAHEYGEIKDEKIWRVAVVNVPELIALLEPLVPLPPELDIPPAEPGAEG